MCTYFAGLKMHFKDSHLRDAVEGSNKVTCNARGEVSSRLEMIECNSRQVAWEEATRLEKTVRVH